MRRESQLQLLVNELVTPEGQCVSGENRRSIETGGEEEGPKEGKKAREKRFPAHDAASIR